MAEFNAMDTAAFKGVWVFCEQREGEIQSISYQLLSEGRKLANDLGVELAGVVMGSGLAEADLKTLGGYGADRVYNIDSPLLKDYTTDGYAKALCDLIMDKKPEIMLIGATNLGRDLGPRCAARLHTGLTADCTHLDVDVEKYKNFLRTTSNIDVDNTKFEENTNLKMTRPAFGGHLMATIICPRFRPCMATVRPGVMKKNAFDEAKANAVEIVKPSFTLTAEDIHTDVTEVVKAACLEAVAATPNVLTEPAPSVYLTDYGSSAIEYSVRCWAETKDYWDVYYALNENLRTAFAAHGVEMTYDHLNVHVLERK